MSAIKKHNIRKMDTSYVRQQENDEMESVKRKKRLVRRLSAFFAIVGIASYFMISSLISQAATIDQMEAEKSQLNQELKGLKKDEVVLKEEIVKLNDDEYIAKLARKDYFLSKKGEIIFSIPEDDGEEKISE